MSEICGDMWVGLLIELCDDKSEKLLIRSGTKCLVHMLYPVGGHIGLDIVNPNFNPSLPNAYPDNARLLHVEWSEIVPCGAPEQNI